MAFARKNLIYIILFAYAITIALTICFFNGTGDSGDSIMHYLFAKYAPHHPELFFDHWAKPLFVLLASPFAQFGFTGMKIFNSLISLATIFITYRICIELKLKNAILVTTLLIFSPLYYILTFSGLTEPLFALFVSAGIYTAVKEKYFLSSVIISFLPFIRSEGLIIIGIFGLFFILKRKWKYIFFLSIGHVVYSIAGYFIYHDLLWVFTKIPYAMMSSPYGKGGIFHFVKEMVDVIGVPIYFLFGTGILIMSWLFIIKKLTIEQTILIFLGFAAYFTAHTLFWHLGIFNSMGLKRVLIGIIPLIAIIALYGFNFIIEIISNSNSTLGKIIYGIILFYIIIFPFTPNPSAIIWQKDMMLSEDQRAAIQLSEYIIANKGKDHRYLFMYSYLNETLNIDCFDTKQKLNLTSEALKQLNKNDIIIWDNWYAVVEGAVSLQQLKEDKRLTNFFRSASNENGQSSLYAFEVN